MIGDTTCVLFWRSCRSLSSLKVVDNYSFLAFVFLLNNIVQEVAVAFVSIFAVFLKKIKEFRKEKE